MKSVDKFYTEDYFTFLSVSGTQADLELMIQINQRNTGLGNKTCTSPHRSNSAAHEPPFISSTADGGDKANPRAASWLGLILDTNVLFIRGVYWFGKSQHNSGRLIHFSSRKTQWCLPVPQPGATRDWATYSFTVASLSLLLQQHKYIKLLSLEDLFIRLITGGIP